MQRTRMVFLSAALAALFGCGGDLGTGPSSDFEGIKYTAEVALVDDGGPKLLSVVVTLRNTTAAAQTRSYPAGCPVRILLYRTVDNALLYDERRRTCATEPVVSITIDPQSTRQLQSGVRLPNSIAGDSLPFTTYNVRAAVMTEGTKTVLIDAGTYTLSGT